MRSNLKDIERGLEYLERYYATWGITSLAVPALGCGHGGLRWETVGPLLLRHFNSYTIPVMLYAPPGTPDAQLAQDFLAAPANGERRGRQASKKSGQLEEHG